MCRILKRNFSVIPKAVSTKLNTVMSKFSIDERVTSRINVYSLKYLEWFSE